ncbi:MAG: A/G-specific adenine glycosylase, partial [Candidatus Nanohaloarchaea archaeon]
HDVDELQELMGVGEYTANAVASFAFNSGGPVFDTNVRRVLYRFHGQVTDDELKAFHRSIFPGDESRRWNNAIMELGAEVCVEGTPRCRDCPWREDCTAWARQELETPEIPDQSEFEGSWRFYRAKVLKLLMDGSMARDGIETELDLPDEYDLDELLSELIDEGMVTADGDTYRLPG